MCYGIDVALDLWGHNSFPKEVKRNPLKPCPFCKGHAQVCVEAGLSYVECRNVGCWCTLGKFYKADGTPAHLFDTETAIIAWNHRE